jgi:hypothetical protein
MKKLVKDEKENRFHMTFNRVSVLIVVSLL